MRSERVKFTCDRVGCGKHATLREIFESQGAWRRVRLGGVCNELSEFVELDTRHACSFKCMQRILIEMTNNLRDNDR
jgi:hypothetical protein